MRHFPAQAKTSVRRLPGSTYALNAHIQSPCAPCVTQVTTPTTSVAHLQALGGTVISVAGPLPEDCTCRPSTITMPVHSTV
jgi:hypothetical protein